MKKRVLVIDLLNVYFTLYHAQTPSKLWKFLADLRTICEQFKIDRVTVTTEGGSRYRETILPTYKWERKKRKAEAPPEEKARLERFMKEEVEDFIQTSKLLGFQVLRVVGAEADDIIAFIANNIDLEKYQVLNLSSDTDLLQLLRPGVVQASYGRDMIPSLSGGNRIPPKVWMNSAQFTAQHTDEENYPRNLVTPAKYAQVKSMAGDTSDSIPSPEGLGEGSALKLIQKYGSIDGIEKALEERTLLCEVVRAYGSVAAAEESIKEGDTVLMERFGSVKAFSKAMKAEVAEFHVPRMSTAAKESLIKGGFEIIRRNMKLVNLNHDQEAALAIFGAAGCAYLEEALKKLDQPQVPDKEALRELMMECGQLNILERLDFWLFPFTSE